MSAGGAIRRRSNQARVQRLDALWTSCNPAGSLLRSFRMSFQPKKNPNPQGKGLVPVLADWESTRPQEFRDRTSADLLFDWFVSALVLSAKFAFKPVVGQSYYLYLRDDDWSLSLIAPTEWSERRSTECLARCELQPDMAWAIKPVEGVTPNATLIASLRGRLEAFLTELDSEAPLEDALPGYRRDIPYYARMLATALGRTLRCSAELHQSKDLLVQPVRQLRLAAQGQIEERLLCLARD